MAYQWMAANDYASFSEIPIETMAGMEDLDEESLESAFTTWKVELRDDDDGLKSTWAVPVVSKTLAELYEERLHDAARKRGLMPDNRPEGTHGSDSSDGDNRGPSQLANSISLISLPQPHGVTDYSSLSDTQLQQHVKHLVSKRKKNRYAEKSGRRVASDITKALDSELVACQVECFNRFITSPTGREMVEANSQMGEWGRGTGRTGMQCILESTIYYQCTDSETRNPGQPGAPITKGANPWLSHMACHTEWEEPVLCKAILFTLDTCSWIGKRPLQWSISQCYLLNMNNIVFRVRPAIICADSLCIQRMKWPTSNAPSWRSCALSCRRAGCLTLHC